MGDVIHDWSCPEINYPLTLENVQRFKNWLLEKELYPSKVQPRTRTLFNPKQERLISRVEKKPLRKPNWKAQIDPIENLVFVAYFVQESDWPGL